MNKTQICPICMGYCLDYLYMVGWKKCHTCGNTFKGKGNPNMKQVTMKDYLGSSDLSALSEAYKESAQSLISKVNELLTKFGEYRPVTSGYRSLEHHLDIYKKKNEDRKRKRLPELKVPMSSRHLSCQAIDLYDVDGTLKKWILVNVALLETLGLYCEDFSHTSTWVHLQIIPYGSWKPGKSRFFIP